MQPAGRDLFYSQMQRILQELSEDKQDVFTKFLIKNFKKELLTYDPYYKHPFVRRALNAILDGDGVDEFFDAIEEYGVEKNRGHSSQSSRLRRKKMAVKHRNSLQEHPDLIEDQDALLEIAKIAAKDPACPMFEFSAYRSKITKKRAIIAMIAAEKNPAYISKFIEKYDVEDEEDRVEIAKIAAREDAEFISEFIERFHIENEKDRIEIAKIAARTNGWFTSMFIESYKINDPEERFKIAKIAAKQNSEKTSKCISLYKLEDEKKRIEIAKIAARQDGEGTSEWIREYNITDPVALIEIAKSAIAQNHRASLYIQKYGITDPKALMTIFLIAFIQSPREATSYTPYYQFPDAYTYFIQAIGEFSRHRFNSEQCARCLQLFADKQNWSVQVQKLILQITQSKDPEVQEIHLCWLTHFLGSCSTLTVEKSSFLLGTNFPKKILNNRDLNLSLSLTEGMLAYAENPNAFGPKGSKNSRAGLVLLLCFVLNAQGVPEDLCQQLISVGGDRLFKDEMESRAYLNGLYLIWKNTKLEASNKTFLFQKIITLSEGTIEQSVKGESKSRTIQHIDAKILLQQLRAVSTILLLEGEDLLKKVLEWEIEQQKLEKEHVLEKISLSDSKNIFSPILLELFRTLIPINSFENFDELYVKHFAEARIPDYIITYAAGLQSLVLEDKKPVLAALSTCVEKMLNGTLSQERYNEHVHLQTVFSGREKLLEQWKLGEKVKLNNFLRPSNIKYDKWDLVDTHDPQDLFLCATESGGSCQDIDYKLSYLNKCLFAYVMDGKIRLLAVKDGSGRIVARHILRILWDGNQPVLFLARLYPRVVKKEIQDALEAFALSRAQQLGLPLLSKEVGQGPVYPRSVESRGSKAPFEYLDDNNNEVAAGVTRGTYKILECRHLNAPLDVLPPKNWSVE